MVLHVSMEFSMAIIQVQSLRMEKFRTERLRPQSKAPFRVSKMADVKDIGYDAEKNPESYPKVRGWEGREDPFGDESTSDTK